MLRSFLSALTSLFRKSTQSFSKISTSNQEYYVDGTDDKDVIKVSGSVSADKNGLNSFDLGGGNDTMTVTGKVSSDTGASNEIDLGAGCNTLTVTCGFSAKGANSANTVTGGDDRDVITSGRLVADAGANVIAAGGGDNRIAVTCAMTAKEGGYNRVTAGDGDDVVTVAGVMESYGNNNAAGLINNVIDAGDGDNYVTISAGMRAYDNGTNTINTGTGDDHITVGKMYSEGHNRIYSEGGDNCVSVRGMEAAAGNNEIVTGNGSDTVCITGTLTAETGYRNAINTGSGDDVVSLCGKVASGGLNLNMGAGYDELILNASKASVFNTNYQDWLTNALQGSDGLVLNVETIQVHLSCKLSDFSSLSWLGDLTAQHAPGIALELSIDNYGRNINLSDLFSDSQANMFGVLDMSGNCRNTLTVNDSFADNGVLDNQLYIQGDRCDTVKLDSDWTAAGSTVNQHGVTYDVYTNSGDSLMVQNEISVLFG